MERFAGMAVGAVVSLLDSVAGAESLPEAEVLARLIDSDCVNLVDDHTGCEQVMLIRSAEAPDQADLVILTDWRTRPGSEPLLIARGFAFNGAMWGMAPSIGVAENGSLRISSEQSGIGRFPWFQTLTLAWREGGFVVAGFSYSTYDRALGGHMACDVNLLTGAYTVDAVRYDAERDVERVVMEEAGRIDAVRVAAADWAVEGVFPAPCAAGQQAAFDGF